MSFWIVEDRPSRFPAHYDAHVFRFLDPHFIFFQLSKAASCTTRMPSTCNSGLRTPLLTVADLSDPGDCWPGVAGRIRDQKAL